MSRYSRPGIYHGIPRNRRVRSATGPAADTVGPEISGDFPEVLAALAARAEAAA